MKQQAKANLRELTQEPPEAQPPRQDGKKSVKALKQQAKASLRELTQDPSGAEPLSDRCRKKDQDPSEAEPLSDRYRRKDKEASPPDEPSPGQAEGQKDTSDEEARQRNAETKTRHAERKALKSRARGDLRKLAHKAPDGRQGNSAESDGETLSGKKSETSGRLGHLAMRTALNKAAADAAAFDERLKRHVQRLGPELRKVEASKKTVRGALLQLSEEAADARLQKAILAAKLQAEYDDRHQRAAVKIQSKQRSKSSRQRVAGMKAARDAAARSHEPGGEDAEADAEDESRRRNIAATRIQSAQRGKAGRGRVGALRAEEAARGEAARVEADRRDVAATRLQSAQRGKVARKQVAAERSERDAAHARRREEAATRLQSAQRGKATRERVATARADRAAAEEADRRGAAATRLQSAQRGKAARQQVAAQRSEKRQQAAAAEALRRDHAATRLQSAQRGKVARQEVVAARAEKHAADTRRRDHAATRLQSAQRGKVARKEVAVVRAERHAAAATRRREYAATRLQCAQRGKVARQKVAAERDAAEARRHAAAGKPSGGAEAGGRPSSGKAAPEDEEEDEEARNGGAGQEAGDHYEEDGFDGDDEDGEEEPPASDSEAESVRGDSGKVLRVAVKILSASNLPSADYGRGPGAVSGVSDPFAICRVLNEDGDEEMSFCTITMDETLDPVWDYEEEVEGVAYTDSLEFAVYDDDGQPKEAGAKGDLLGTAYLRTSKIFERLARAGKNKVFEETLELLTPKDPTREDEPTEIRVLLEVVDAYDATAVDRCHVARTTNMEVVIEYARAVHNEIGTDGFLKFLNKPNARLVRAPLDLYCTCRVLGGAVATRATTKVAKNTASPVWNFKSKPLKVSTGDALEFCLYVADNSGDKLRGRCVLSTNDFFERGFNSEVVMTETGLSKDRLGLLSVVVTEVGTEPPRRRALPWRPQDRRKRFRCLAKGTPFLLSLNIAGAKALCNADGAKIVSRSSKRDKSDPYVVLRVKGYEFTTNVVKDDLDPIWNFPVILEEYDSGEALDFAVYDRGESGRDSDQLLGTLTMVSGRFVPNGFSDNDVPLTNLLGLREGSERAQSALMLDVKSEAEAHEEKQKKLEAEEAKLKAEGLKFQLHVKIIGAKGLKVPSDAKQARDLFVRVQVPGRQDSGFATQAVKNNGMPVWNVDGKVEYNRGESLHFDIWSKAQQRGEKEQIVGRLLLKPSDIIPHGFTEERTLTQPKGTTASFHAIVEPMKIEEKEAADNEEAAESSGESEIFEQTAPRFTTRLTKAVIPRVTTWGDTEAVADEMTSAADVMRKSRIPLSDLIVPKMLWLKAPNDMYENPMSGIYRLVDGRRPNGFPLWQQVDGEHFIFSGPNGHWLLGDEQEQHANFLVDTGTAATVAPHGGTKHSPGSALMPDEMAEKGGWQMFHQDEWRETFSFTVSREAPMNAVRVTIFRATGLFAELCRADSYKRRNVLDVYVVCHLSRRWMNEPKGGDSKVLKTPVCMDTNAPYWGFQGLLQDVEETDEVVFTVADSGDGFSSPTNVTMKKLFGQSRYRVQDVLRKDFFGSIPILRDGAALPGCSLQIKLEMMGPLQPNVWTCCPEMRELILQALHGRYGNFRHEKLDEVVSDCLFELFEEHLHAIEDYELIYFVRRSCELGEEDVPDNRCQQLVSLLDEEQQGHVPLGEFMEWLKWKWVDDRPPPKGATTQANARLARFQAKVRAVLNWKGFTPDERAPMAWAHMHRQKIIDMFDLRRIGAFEGFELMVVVRRKLKLSSDTMPDADIKEVVAALQTPMNKTGKTLPMVCIRTFAHFIDPNLEKVMHDYRYNHHEEDEADHLLAAADAAEPTDVDIPLDQVQREAEEAFWPRRAKQLRRLDERGGDGSVSVEAYAVLLKQQLPDEDPAARQRFLKSVMTTAGLGEEDIRDGVTRVHVDALLSAEKAVWASYRKQAAEEEEARRGGGAALSPVKPDGLRSPGAPTSTTSTAFAESPQQLAFSSPPATISTFPGSPGLTTFSAGVSPSVGKFSPVSTMTALPGHGGAPWLKQRAWSPGGERPQSPGGDSSFTHEEVCYGAHHAGAELASTSSYELSAMERFRKALRQFAPSVTAAWRQVLDRNWSMKLSKRDFCEFCRKNNVFDTAENLKQAWLDVDTDNKGILNLWEVDWSSMIMLGEFQAQLRAKFGGMGEAIARFGLDCRGARLRRKPWMRRLRDARLASCQNAEVIFWILVDHSSTKPSVTADGLRWMEVALAGLELPMSDRAVPGVDENPSDLMDVCRSGTASDVRAGWKEWSLRNPSPPKQVRTERLYEHACVRMENYRQAELAKMSPRRDGTSVQKPREEMEQITHRLYMAHFKKLEKHAEKAEVLHTKICPPRQTAVPCRAVRQEAQARLCAPAVQALRPQSPTQALIFKEPPAIYAESPEHLEASVRRLHGEHNRRVARNEERRRHAEAAQEPPCRRHAPENYCQGAWERNFNENSKRIMRIDMLRAQKAKDSERQIDEVLNVVHRDLEGPPNEYTFTRLHLDHQDKENRLHDKRLVRDYSVHEYMVANSVHARTLKATGDVHNRLHRNIPRDYEEKGSEMEDELREELERLAEEEALEELRLAEEKRRAEEAEMAAAEAAVAVEKPKEDTPAKGKKAAEKGVQKGGAGGAPRGTMAGGGGGKGKGGGGAARGTMVGGGGGKAKGGGGTARGTMVGGGGKGK
eukprot:TRINITY_DN728_c1_g1_i6.p1 TRINITY_DN728_c1_g1~~TRINITY_DN728_c1_g1_i6.p1  ORF type:complete len:2694 (-),score=795.11 TRINITY_DN728_c1_g1_i6:102-8183(-)